MAQHGKKVWIEGFHEAFDEGTRRRAIVSPIPAIPGEETKPADHKLASVNGVLGVLKKGGRPSSPYSG